MNDTKIRIYRTGHSIRVFLPINGNFEKSILIFSIVAVVLLITVLFFTDNSSIKDTNGADDYSLCQISLDEIINDSVSSSETFPLFKSFGNSSFVTNIYKDKDYDNIKCSAKKKSGTSVINATYTNKNTVTFKLDSKIFSGNCRIIVTVDNEYYDEFNLNCSDEITLTDVSNKTVYIIMGCESTEFELDLHREIM